MYHHKQRDLDKRLKQLFDDVDREMEDRYGDRYQLHPSRPEEGETANPAADGLFNIGASFSPGYGTELGRGYVLDVDIATLEDVPDDVEQQIVEEAVDLIRQRLPEYFPDRSLRLERDGSLLKIVGDFTLGSV